MNKNYTVAASTEEADLLTKIPGRGKVVVFETTNLYRDKLDAPLNQSEHPREKAFDGWLESKQQNQVWYEQNRDKLKLVDDGIEILGDVFCLENEQAESNGLDIWNHQGHTYFSFNAALRHAAEQGRRIPSDGDWSKYLTFLPGDNLNKFRFFTEVLGVKPAGGLLFHGSRFSKQGTHTYLWSSSAYSSTIGHGRYLNWDNPTVNRDRFYMGNGFSLRCIKDSGKPYNSHLHNI